MEEIDFLGWKPICFPPSVKDLDQLADEDWSLLFKMSFRSIYWSFPSLVLQTYIVSLIKGTDEVSSSPTCRDEPPPPEAYVTTFFKVGRATQRLDLVIGLHRVLFKQGSPFSSFSGISIVG